MKNMAMYSSLFRETKTVRLPSFHTKSVRGIKTVLKLPNLQSTIYSMATAIMVTPTIPHTAKRAAPGALLPSAGSQHRKKQRIQEMSPLLLLRSIFGNAGLVNSSPQSFMKPTDEEIEAYDLVVVRAIRMGDLEKLKQLHKEGKNLNASNQFGESLLHMACRRGNIDILTFMLREAKTRVDRRDDFGRNPLHDACWTASPNFDVMDELLEFVDPFLLLAEDVRGSTPFDYVRQNHWSDWVKYLTAKQQRIQERIREVQESETSTLMADK